MHQCTENQIFTLQIVDTKKRKEMSAQESVGRVNGNQQLLSTRFRVKLQPFMPFI